MVGDTYIVDGHVYALSTWRGNKEGLQKNRQLVLSAIRWERRPTYTVRPYFTITSVHVTER